jgi:hypothetical protein
MALNNYRVSGIYVAIVMVRKRIPYKAEKMVQGGQG